MAPERLENVFIYNWKLREAGTFQKAPRRIEQVFNKNISNRSCREAPGLCASKRHLQHTTDVLYGGLVQ